MKSNTCSNESTSTHQNGTKNYCTSATFMIYFHHNNKDKRRRNDGRRASAILTISRLEPNQNEEKRQRVFLRQKMETLRCLPGSGFKSGSNHRRAGAGEACQGPIKNKASSSIGWQRTTKKFFIVARSLRIEPGKPMRDGPSNLLLIFSIHSLSSNDKAFGYVLCIEIWVCVESLRVSMNDKPKYKAIETIHSGYRFRSRLEARWAVFFETLGIEYRYEPEGFELENGIRYLPDFYLPRKPHWIEIKPDLPSVEEKEKAVRLCLATRMGVTIFYGDIWTNVKGINFVCLPEEAKEGLIADRQTNSSDFTWISSEECIVNGDADHPAFFVNVGLGFMVREAVWAQCNHCNAIGLAGMNNQLHQSQEECNQPQNFMGKSTLLEAFTAARQARF